MFNIFRGSSSSTSSNSGDNSFTLWGSSSSSSSRISSNQQRGGPSSKDTRQRYSTLNSKSEYHVQSHLFRELETDSRYEVIVQTRNKFGWSRPTKSFIFSTRDKGKIQIILSSDMHHFLHTKGMERHNN